MVDAAQWVTPGHTMAGGDTTTVPDTSMGRRRGTRDLKAEVVEVGGCPSGCPRFKERIKWACT